MKVSNLTKAACAGAFAITVAALPFAKPVSAQTDTTAPTTTDPSIQTPVDTEDDDDGFDWGLLGLLGLLGLAGLARKPEERVQYRDPNVDPAATSSTRSDYYR